MGKAVIAWKRLTPAFILSMLLLLSQPLFSAALCHGMTGAAIRKLQQDLAYLGYLGCLPTGYYGPQTVATVRAFQRANGLQVDGIAGARTLSVLAEKVRMKNADLSSRRNDSVGLLPWEEVSRLFPRGATARVWDVEARRSFIVWRFQGSYHADVEPLTKADTAVLLEVSGGRWTKARRAALVEIEGRLVAASMYPFPHGREGIADNGFPGQFCLHFLGSRIHQSGRVDPAHQAMILRAAQACPDWEAPSAPPGPANTPHCLCE